MTDGLVFRGYKPQSYKWGEIVVVLPEEMAQAFDSGSAVCCDLMIAKDGNKTLVRASPGEGWLLMKFNFSGEYALLRGEGHFFLASSGSWSGGGNYKGFIALKPGGALVRFGAKGCWNYLVCTDEEIAIRAHDPRLFEEGSSRWKPL